MRNIRNNIQILPIIASVGIGAAAYSVMTGRGGQLQNVVPQLSGMGNQGTNNQNNESVSSDQQKDSDFYS